MKLGSRKKHAKRVGRPRREGLDPAVSVPTVPGGSPASLPLPGGDPTPSASTSLETLQGAPAAPWWRLPAGSSIKATALAIVAQRAAGLEDAAIAEALGISPKTISGYLFKAGKNGWLSQDATLYDPKDRFEYQIGHKVVRNIEQALDDPDPERRMQVALKMAEYTLHKKGDGQVAQAPVMAVMAIRIEHVDTGPIREGTIKGTPAFLEGETCVPTHPE